MGRIFRSALACLRWLPRLTLALLCLPLLYLATLGGPAAAVAGQPAAEEPLDCLDQSAPSPPALYESLARDGRAALVTTDSAIWALALVHDRTLSAVETRFLAPRLARILDRLDRALAPAEQDPPSLRLDHDAQPLPAALAEPARHAHRFVQVARALLEGKAESGDASARASASAKTSELPEAVRRELDRIARHETSEPSDVLDQAVDYRLFAPTGRAGAAPELARFQAASVWLGRMVFRLDERTSSTAPLDVPPPAVASGWFTGLDPQAAAAGNRDAMAHLAIAYPRRGMDEMRASAILCLLMEHLKVDGAGPTCLDNWREIDAFLQAWQGPAPDLDAPALLESLHQRVTNKPTFDNALQFLADDDRCRGWIAWLGARLRCGSDPDLARRRRGFAFLGLRPEADLRILQTVTAGPEWHGVPTTPAAAPTAFTRVDSRPKAGPSGAWRGATTSCRPWARPRHAGF